MCNLYDIGPGQGKRNETVWEKIVFRGLSAAQAKLFGTRKTDPGLVLLSENDYDVMRWGFHRPFNPAINNARRDKLESGMWNKAWREKRRCIIPVSTYYEWSGPKGHKQTHAFQPDTPDRWLWIGGLWEESAEFGMCYSMITTDASEKTGRIHDRMPALLQEDYLADFLTRDDPIELLKPSEEVAITMCENPLKNPHHEGPVFTPTLPGFE